jgi:hypothetical protein
MKTHDVRALILVIAAWLGGCPAGDSGDDDAATDTPVDVLVEADVEAGVEADAETAIDVEVEADEGVDADAEADVEPVCACTAMTAPGGLPLVAIAGDPAGRVLAAGSSLAWEGAVLALEGDAWTVVQSFPDTRLFDVAVLPGGRGYVLGEDFGGHAVVLRSDGGAWEATAVMPDARFTSIWAAGADDLFAVGYGVAARFDGTAWSSLTVVGDPQLKGVWGSGPDDVFAVGFRVGAGGAEAAGVRWNGTAWSELGVSGAGLEGVAGTSGSDVWAVGASHRPLHWDGASWTEVPLAGIADAILFDVFAAPAGATFAVGFLAVRDRGLLAGCHDGVWAEIACPASAGLAGVWGRSADEVFAVGVDAADDPVIVRYACE